MLQSKAAAVAVVRLETRALAALVKDAAVDLGDIALDSAADAVNSAAHIGAQIRYTAAQVLPLSYRAKLSSFVDPQMSFLPSVPLC